MQDLDTPFASISARELTTVSGGGSGNSFVYAPVATVIATNHSYAFNDQSVSNIVQQYRKTSSLF